EFEVGRVPVAAACAEPARPAGGQDPGHAVQRVDTQSRVVRDGRKAGVRGDRPGLEQGVAGEGRLGLGHLGGVRVSVEAADLDVEPRLAQDGAQFGDLLGVAGGEYESADRAHSVSAFFWISVSSAHPATARSSRESRSLRSKGALSAVPWTSMNSPVPVTTTFMSVCATESSR